MILTYFLLVAVCWVIGIVLWRKVYVGRKEEN